MSARGTVRGTLALVLAAACAVAPELTAAAAAAPAPAWTTSVLPVANARGSAVVRPDAHTTWIAGTRVTDPRRIRFAPLLLERDDRTGSGSWHEVALPELPAGTDVQMYGADASSADSGVIVGDHAEQIGGLLTERWNGDSWRIIPAPVPEGTLGAALLDVEEFAPDDAWAVGFTQILDGTVPDPEGGTSEYLDHFEPVLRHWDGTAWRTAPVPAGVADSWWLLSMAATSPDDIWAVGRTAELAPVVVHYDGTIWSGVPLPTTHAANGELRGVVARGPRDVWAVGGARTADGEGAEAFALHFDGTAWREVPMPAGTGVLDHATALPKGVAFAGNADAGEPFGLRVERGRIRSLGLPVGTDPEVQLTAIDARGPELLVTGYLPVYTDTTFEPVPVLLTQRP
jgi:photosystem II stability/assembly factor-like uncharacterized protein